MRALAHAQCHPDTPWYARAVALSVVAYALSPINLIPDFIHVLGLVDDLILLPLGIYLALKPIPEGVMLESRQRVHETAHVDVRSARWGALVVICIWLALLARSVIRLFQPTLVMWRRSSPETRVRY